MDCPLGLHHQAVLSFLFPIAFKTWAHSHKKGIRLIGGSVYPQTPGCAAGRWWFSRGSWRVDTALVGHGPRFPGWGEPPSLESRPFAAAGATTAAGSTFKPFPGALLPTPSPQKERVPGKGPWKAGSDGWGCGEVTFTGEGPCPPRPPPLGWGWVGTTCSFRWEQSS